MRLYELSAEYERILDLAYAEAVDGEIPESIANQIDVIEADIDQKLAACCRIVRNLEADAEAIKAEVARFHRKKNAAENAVESLKAYMAIHLDKMGMDSRKVDSMFTIALQNSPAAVQVDSLDQVPTTFDKVQPRAIDITAIKDRLKKGESIPGCQLITRKHLRIR